MVQIKHLTASQKWLIFKFQDMQIGLGGTKYFIAPPARQESYCESNSKPVLVIVAIRPFTCQSFRQNYVSREISLKFLFLFFFFACECWLIYFWVTRLN